MLLGIPRCESTVRAKVLFITMSKQLHPLQYETDSERFIKSTRDRVCFPVDMRLQSGGKGWRGPSHVQHTLPLRDLVATKARGAGCRAAAEGLESE